MRQAQYACLAKGIVGIHRTDAWGHSKWLPGLLPDFFPGLQHKFAFVIGFSWERSRRWQGWLSG